MASEDHSFVIVSVAGRRKFQTKASCNPAVTEMEFIYKITVLRHWKNLFKRYRFWLVV
jgi:hypothetical protein